MKRTGLAAAVVALTLVLAACGGSGRSKSYKLGQYDGPRLKVATASPAGITAACKGQLAEYLAAHQLGQVLDANPAPGTSGGPDVASTPDFTIKIPDIARSDYVSGCRAALKTKLG